jgi:nitrogen fixation protein
MARVPFVQFISSNGDGTGTTDLIGDYSGASPTNFEYEVPAAERHHLIRLIALVKDTGNFDADKWGNGITLTNGWGLTVQQADDTVIADLTPETVKTAADLSAYCFDVRNDSFGIGDEVLAARWTFGKFTERGEGIVLDDGERLVLSMHDDYSDLTLQHFVIQGYKAGVFY